MTENHAEQGGTAGSRLAAQIRQLRRAAQLSQPQLAQRIGYTRQYVSLAERPGANLPSHELVVALDNALNANGTLVALRAQARAEQRSLRNAAVSSPAASIAGGGAIAEQIRRSQEQWLRVREAPGARGRELTELAAWLYEPGQRGPGGHLLAGPSWLLEEPVELDAVNLDWSDTHPPVPPPDPLDHVLPLTSHGTRYAGYSRAVRDLVRPRLLENRLSYRLLDVRPENGLALTFGTTTFFDVFDLKQALVHEFKAAWLASNRSIPDWTTLPLRTAIGDPFDPMRLLMSPGISTLTIRRDPAGEHRFILHERDGGKVADGGGLCHVAPAGEFQPSCVDPAGIRHDFSLWRTVMREFSEELLGNPEHDGSCSRPIDYPNNEPFLSFERAKADGRFRIWHYGLAMEPLELGAVQLTVAVIDADTFDQLFARMVTVNDEGTLIGKGDRIDIPFTAEAIERLNPRLSASAVTLLELAHRHRNLLLDTPG